MSDVIQSSSSAAGAAWPASAGQRRIWLLDQLYPASRAYSLFGGFTAHGPLSVADLDKSIRAVLERHRVLRSVFALEAGLPVVHIQPVPERVVEHVDVAHQSSAEAVACAKHALQKHGSEGFDLEKGPLYRCTVVSLSNNEHRILISIHHTIADGVSLRVIFDEISAHYRSFAAGLPLELEPVVRHYDSFVRNQEEFVKSDAGLAQLSESCERLTGAPPYLSIPADATPLDGAEYHDECGSLDLSIDSKTVDRLREVGKRHGATLFMVLLAIFGRGLAKFSGTSDLVISLPTANRSLEDQKLTGMLINVVPVRLQVDVAAPVDLLIAQSRAATLRAARCTIPFAHIYEALAPKVVPGRQPYTGALINLHPLDDTTLDLHGLEVERDPQTYTESRSEVEWDIEERDGALVGSLVFNRAILSDGGAAGLVEMCRGAVLEMFEPVVPGREQSLTVQQAQTGK